MQIYYSQIFMENVGQELIESGSSGSKSCLIPEESKRNFSGVIQQLKYSHFSKSLPERIRELSWNITEQMVYNPPITFTQLTF